MGLVVSDLSYSTVAGAPSPALSGTSITVSAGHGARFPAAPFYAYAAPSPFGTGSIPSGSTSTVITHNLGVAPALRNIMVILGELATNAPGEIYVDTITSTQFTVRCRNNPGGSNLLFGWQVLVPPTLDNAEKVLVTAKATDVFTIVRGQGATTAKSIATNWGFYMSAFDALAGREYIVAASDATAEEKMGATSICDGTADDVEIQAAIDSGRPVRGTTGTYTLAAHIDIDGGKRDVRFPPDSYLVCAETGAGSCAVYMEDDSNVFGFHEITSAGQYVIKFRDLIYSRIVGNALGHTSPAGAGKIACLFHDGASQTTNDGGNYWEIARIEASNSQYGIKLDGHATHIYEADRFSWGPLYAPTAEGVRVGSSATQKVRWHQFEGEVDALGVTPILWRFFNDNNLAITRSYATKSPVTDFQFESGTAGNVIYATRGVLADDPTTSDSGRNTVRTWRSVKRIPLAPLNAFTDWQFDGHGSIGGVAHLHAADGADTTFHFSPVPVPIDFMEAMSLNISLHVNGTSAGNIKINRFASVIAVNGDTAEALPLNVNNGQVAPTAANTTKNYSFAFSAAPEVNSLIRAGVQFTRADAGVDTNTNQVSFLGAWLEYYAK